MKIIHTSDWQIGKVFRIVDDATMSLLQDARLEAISAVGRAAHEQGAAAVIVAGDVYDMEALSDRTLGQPIERMRQFPKIEWHLMPGNHDHYRDGGLWDRLLRKSLPDNVMLHLTPEPKSVCGGAAWLLPAPLDMRRSLADLTAYMDDAATPDGAPRIGLGHGSITEFGQSAPTHNYIDPDRPRKAGLAYLALGDWHGMKSIGERIWYSGTPETDAFAVQDGGHALLVDLLGPQAAPVVTPLATGRYHWFQHKAAINGPDDIEVLAERLRALHAEPGRVLVDLTVEGALSLAERKLFEDKVTGSLGDALRFLRLDDTALLLRPTADDLDAIDHGGFVRAAADKLKALADNPANPQRDIALLALQRLYVEHRKRAAS